MTSSTQGNTDVDRRKTDPLEESITCVMEIGRALHQNGSPTHRVEEILARASEILRLEGQFFVTPTSIIAGFGPTGGQRTALLRLDIGGVDLGRLARLDDAVKAMLSGERTPAETLIETRAIMDATPRYRGLVSAISLAVCSATAARFFGGGWLEVLVAWTIGVAQAGLLVLLREHRAAHLLAPAAAMLVTVLAHATVLWIVPMRLDVVIVAGVLYFLPGMTLTVAVTELSTGHVISGTARAMLAAVVLFELAFGVALGRRLVPVGVPELPLQPFVLPWYVDAFALVVAALGFVVLFQGRMRDAGWTIAVAFVAYFGARVGVGTLGSIVGVWIAALLVGICANAYARLLDRPSILLAVPGTLFLVPGAVGFRSMDLFLESDAIAAVNTAFEMGLLAVAISVGILMANFVVDPRRLA